MLYRWLSKLRNSSVKRYNLSFVSTSRERFVIQFDLFCVNFFKNKFENSIISDQTRFLQWMNACNNPRFSKLDKVLIHKRYRICRRHFDSDCLNGGCRRLLNTAVPTLYLNDAGDRVEIDEINESIDGDNDTLLALKQEITFVPVSNNDSDNGADEHFEVILTSKPQPMTVPSLESMFHLNLYEIQLKIV